MLIAIPVVWSLPTSLMVGELASALPEEGGYYCWVRRALGGFWGFQEAWLSMAASVFDMAIYPVIFVLYLGRIEPAWTAGGRGTLWALAVIVLCAAWNLRGARAVGEGSVGLFCVLLSPFVVLTAVGFWKAFGGGHAFGGVREGLARLKAPWLVEILPGRSLWRCGTIWAGTTPRPWRRRWTSRRGTIRGRCWWRRRWWR